jgi:two-component system sensor histidine kinase/response regulator
MEFYPPPVILIVDDNQRNLMVLGAMLRKLNAEITEAQSGQEALGIIEKSIPDLILLDIMMPRMDGLEVCAIIKSNPLYKDIAIIFISALDSTTDKIRGLEAGGVDYITKPFQKEEVLARVKTHLTVQYQQKALEKANKDLRLANATKDRLFSIIAHDLLGNVSNVSNVLKLLTEMVISPIEQQEFLHAASGTIKNTHSLLKNLLFWAKSQRNEIDYNPHNINVSIVVNDNIALMKSQIKEKHLVVNNHIPEGYICFADENMLSTIFRNLISNAIKYSFEKGTINITYTETNEDFLFCVEDTGIGIPDENLPMIFDTYSSFSTPGTNYEKGTGLGLILCKEFVEKQGGKIWVESQPEKGSRFSFTIPVPEINYKYSSVGGKEKY